MNVDDFLKNGTVKPNPNWTKANAKKGVPKYLETYDVSDNKSLASSDLEKIVPFQFSLDGGNNLESYSEHDVTINPINTQEELDKERARNQGAMEQLGHALVQTAVNEIGIGTAQAIANLVQFDMDLFSGRFFDDDYSFSNPISEKLEEWKADVKNKFDIYRENPNASILDGGLTDWGWYMENAPSIMSSLTLLLPSAAATRGLGWTLSKANKVFGLGSKLAKAERAGSATARALRGFGVEGTTKNAMVKTATQAGFSRVLENYQEAAQVYRDNESLAREYFNSKDFDKEQFIKDNTKIDEYGNEVFAYQDCLKDGVTQDVERENELLNGEPTGNIKFKTVRKPEDYDWDKIAKYIGGKAAESNFKGNLTNYIFDFWQVYSLRNFVKGFKNKNSSFALDNFAKEATGNWRKSAEEVARANKVHNKLLRTTGRFLNSEKNTILAEASEGIEEGVNYISTEYGNHTGKVLLGDAKDEFRVNSYLNNGELWDSMFWGVIGGVVFQHLGSGFNRLSNKLWKNQEKSEIESRKDNINRTMSGLNSWISQASAIDEGYNIYDTKDVNGKESESLTNDDKYNKFADEEGSTIEEQKLKAKQRLANDVLNVIAVNAAVEGNSGILRSMLKDENVRKQLKDAGVLSDVSDEQFMHFVENRLEKVENNYDNALTILSGHNVNPNYAVMIAADVTNNLADLDDINNIKTEIDGSINKIVADNPDLISAFDLEEYRQGILNQRLIGNLRKLREERKSLSKNKDVSSILRVKELDSKIKALEGSIERDLDIVGYHSRRLTDGDTEESDKWMEEHIKDFTRGKDLEEGEIEKERIRIRNGLFGYYSSIKYRNPVLADLLVNAADCELALRDLKHKTTLTPELITERVNALDKTFNNARAKVRSASEAVIDEMYKKYNANDVFEYINSKKEIPGIEKEDLEKLDSAIAQYDLLSDDNDTMINIFKSKAQLAEYVKTHSEEVRDNENPIENEPKEESEETEDSSTGGIKEAPVNPTPQPNPQPTPQPAPTPEIDEPFSGPAPAPTPNPQPAPNPAPVEEGFRAYSEAEENKINEGSSKKTDDEIINEATNTIIAELKANGVSGLGDTKFNEIVLRYVNSHPELGMLTSLVLSSVKRGFRAYLASTNNLSAINSSLGELAYDNRATARYVETLRALVDKYIEDTHEGRRINNRRFINLQAFIRYIKFNNGDRVLADDAFKNLVKFILEENNKKGSARTIIFLDNASDLTKEEYLAETNLSIEELNKKQLDAMPISSDIYNVVKSLEGDEQEKFNRVFDSLKVGDKLDYAIEETSSGNRVLMLSVGNVKLAQLPIPDIDSKGRYVKSNDLWNTDVQYVNGVPKSNFVDYLKNNVIPGSEIFDLILDYEEADTNERDIILAKIRKTKEWKELEKFKVIPDNESTNRDANDRRRVFGLFKLITYSKSFDVAGVQRSYDNWSKKVAENYEIVSTFIHGNTNGSVVVSYIHGGDVNRSDEGNLPSTALANYDPQIHKLGVVSAAGYVTISDRQTYHGMFANGKAVGIPYIVFNSDNEEPTFVRISPVGLDEISTQDGRDFVNACKNEMFKHIMNFVNAEQGEHEQAFYELCKFMDLLFSTKDSANTPFKTKVPGTHKVSCDTGTIIRMDLGNDKIRFFRNSHNGGKATRFLVNDNQYILDRTSVINLINYIFSQYNFQVTDQYLANDGSKELHKDGIFSWENGKLTVSIGKFTKTYDSYSDFLIKNDMIKCHTKQINGSNFNRNFSESIGPKMEVKLLSNQPVEGTTIDLPSNAVSIADIFKNRSNPTAKLLRIIFGKNKKALNNVLGLHILSENIIFVNENVGHEASTITRDRTVNGKHYSKGTILIGKEFEKILKDNPGRAARILLHENLHSVLIDEKNRKVLENIKGIKQEFINSLSNPKYISEFAKSVGKPEDTVKNWLNGFVSPYGNNENANIEEFLVESLTNKDLINYLNSVDAEAEFADEENMSLWQKILKFIGELFRMDVRKGSLREKEFYALADSFEEINAVPEETKIPTEEKAPTEESADENNQKEESETQEEEEEEDDTNDYIDSDNIDDLFSAAGEISDSQNIGTLSGYISSFDPMFQPEITALFEAGTLQISCR